MTICGSRRCFAASIYSVQFSHSVVSNSLQPHGLQHVIKSMMPCNHLILCCPLLHLPSIFRSIRVFSKESVLFIRGPRYWTFSFSISPANEYSGLISFDWLVWYSCSPRDSQESSTTPQFKSINSSALSFRRYYFFLYMRILKELAVFQKRVYTTFNGILFLSFSKKFFGYFWEIIIPSVFQSVVWC